ncbi:MAG: glutamate--tRNA ligase [Patescibacteria group bacterium]|nr:glutamate--tRNA ligase [Patescibacteria group bacterium]
MKVITRIAPSPTGKLHIGTARTALYNWLFARKEKGQFILRFEDTDKERSTKENEENIREGLKWLGLDWNKEFLQMDRLDLYQKYAKELVLKNFAYEKEGATWFKIPKDKKITFRDLVQGEITFDSSEFKDFVIVRSDGIPIFYLSNVIDDIEMGITHVLRGADHITNTPKQLLIYEALDKKPPFFGHISLNLTPERKKLSKRYGPVGVSDFKALGYLPEAIINFVVLLGWNPGIEKEYFTLEELIKEFSIERLQKSPSIFDINKLNSTNSHYIQKIDSKNLLKIVREILPELKGINDDFLLKVIEVEKTRISYLAQIKDFDFYFNEPKYDPKLLIFKKSDKERTFKGLSLATNHLTLATNDIWDSVEKLNNLLAQIVEKEGLDNGSVFWPVRAALSGKEASPSPAELLWVFGKEESLKRLEKALSILEK